MVWNGLAPLGMVWHGLVPIGMVLHGLALVRVKHQVKKRRSKTEFVLNILLSLQHLNIDIKLNNVKYTMTIRESFTE